MWQVDLLWWINLSSTSRKLEVRWESQLARISWGINWEERNVSLSRVLFNRRCSNSNGSVILLLARKLVWLMRSMCTGCLQMCRSCVIHQESMSTKCEKSAPTCERPWQRLEKTHWSHNLICCCLESPPLPLSHLFSKWETFLAHWSLCFTVWRV